MSLLEDLICKPLDSLTELLCFEQDPPAWRTLCKELNPHSKYQLKNSLLTGSADLSSIQVEKTQTFCHYDPCQDRAQLARTPADQLPRTLVCHDMANGYHDDSMVDGTGNCNAYSFYNWAGVDIFCYFSHHLVTIPPLGWINVGHENGVQVLGTLITEWADGVAFWQKVLASEDIIQNTVSALVAIAKTLKFDGWLLNVENKVGAPAALLAFVRALHAQVRAELPHGLVLWYDSVTEDGTLNWQNKLNDKNKVYFDACDGIFTNYSWLEEDVAESMAAAGARRRDVFVGMDVWGRNFHGGGMFNLQEAMKVAYSHGCSVALFAPAWTHEALAEPHNDILMGDHLDTFQRFRLRDRALWDSIWPFLNTKLPCTLPFQTSFCTGQGPRRRLNGEVLVNRPWYNLRHQQYQPNSAHGPHGYLLSTQVKLTRVTQTPSDGGNATRIREQLNQMEDKQPDKADDDDDDDKVLPVGRVDSVMAVQESTEQTSKSSRMKNVFRNIFRFRKKRLMSSDEEGPPPAEKEGAAGTEDATASSSRLEAYTPSVQLVEPSVQLQLVKKERKRLQLACVKDERPCVQLYLRDSFNGGGCVLLNPSDAVRDAEPRTIRLLHCDFPCRDALVVCAATKRPPGAQAQYATLRLAARAAERELETALVCRPVAGGHPGAAAPRTVYPANCLDTFPDLRAYLLLHQPGFYVPIDNSFGWQVWYFVVPLGGATVTSIACLTGEATSGLLLGHLAICDVKLSALQGAAAGAGAAPPSPVGPAVDRDTHSQRNSAPSGSSAPSASTAAKQSQPPLGIAVHVLAEPAHSLAAESAHSLAAEPAHSLAAELAHSLAAESAHSLATESAHSLAIEPARSLAAEPARSLAAEPAHSFATEPAHSLATESAHSLAVEPTRSLAAEPARSLAAEPARSLAAEPDHSFAAEPAYSLAAEPAHTLAAKPAHRHKLAALAARIGRLVVCQSAKSTKS